MKDALEDLLLFLMEVVLNPGCALMLVLVALFAGMIAFAHKEEQRWLEWAKMNECRAVRYEDGSYATGLAGDKVVSVYTPGKTTYRCRNGVEYVR